MKKIFAALALVTAVAACTPTEKGAVIGGGTGALIGGMATNSAGGAVVGGVAGAAAGALIGRASERGMCTYEDQYGRRYTARCPSGY